MAEEPQDPPGEPEPTPSPVAEAEPLEQPVRRHQREGVVTLRLTELMRAGWRALASQPGASIGGFMLSMGVMSLVILVMIAPVFYAAWLSQNAPALLPRVPAQVALVGWQVVFITVLLVFTTWTTLGLTVVYLKIVRGQRPHARDVFGQGKLLAAGLTLLLIEYGCTTLGTLFCYVPGLLLTSLFSLSILFLVDRGLDPFSAMRASANAVWGWSTVLKLLLLYLFMTVLGAFLITLPIVIPWAVLMFTIVYVELSDRVTCPWCSEKAAPVVELCPYCDEELAPSPTWEVKVPARPVPRWIEVAAFFLLIPLLAVGGNPVGGVIPGLQLGGYFQGAVPLVAGFGVGLGAVMIPSIAATLLLYHRYSSFRPVELDDWGCVFGKSDAWEGVRIPWRRVEGFRLTGHGIMLKIDKQPWTRWLGPLIRSDDLLTHEIVVALEQKEIYSLEGRE